MKARIIANGVQVRKESSNSSPAIGSVALGEEIEIEAEYGEWVKLTGGGWVMTCYTEAIEVGGGGSVSALKIIASVSYDSSAKVARLSDVCYDDGTPLTYSTREVFVEQFETNCAPCVIFNTNGERVGVVIACSAGETSDGYQLCISGYARANYAGTVAPFAEWLS